jgi:hypothetical protein
LLIIRRHSTLLEHIAQESQVQRAVDAAELLDLLDNSASRRCKTPIPVRVDLI